MASKVTFSIAAAQDQSQASPVSITRSSAPLTGFILSRLPLCSTDDQNLPQDKPFRKAIFYLGFFGGILNFLCSIAGIAVLSILPYTITLAVMTAWLILSTLLSISTGLHLAKTLSLPPATPSRNIRLSYLLRFAVFLSSLSLLLATACFLHGLVLLLQMTRQSRTSDETDDLFEEMQAIGLHEAAENMHNQVEGYRRWAGSAGTGVGLVAFLINMMVLSVVWKARRMARDGERGPDGVSVIPVAERGMPPPSYATMDARRMSPPPRYSMSN